MKRNRPPERTAFAAILLALLLLSGPGSMAAGESAPGSQVDWNKTVGLAEQEGQVMVYVQSQLGEVLANSAFKRKFPKINLTWVTGPGSDLVPRIMAERRGEKFLVDVVANFGNTSPYTLYQAKVLDPITSAFILPEVKDQSMWFQGKHHYIDPDSNYIFIYMGAPQYFVSYNKNLANPSEFKSYQDLLNLKWKGRIAAMDPRTAGYGATISRFFYHHPQLGPDFPRRLYSETDITLFRDARQGSDWLASGKFALCLCQSAALAKAAKQGLPVDFIDPHALKERPPLGSGGHTMALINKAPHPNAAKVFINWFLSRDGQLDYQTVSANDPEGIEGSLRIDVPRDLVSPRNRIVAGANYVPQWTPDMIDMKPVRQIIDEALANTQK